HCRYLDPSKELSKSHRKFSDIYLDLFTSLYKWGFVYSISQEIAKKYSINDYHLNNPTSEWSQDLNNIAHLNILWFSVKNNQIIAIPNILKSSYISFEITTGEKTLYRTYSPIIHDLMQQMNDYTDAKLPHLFEDQRDKFYNFTIKILRHDVCETLFNYHLSVLQAIDDGYFSKTHTRLSKKLHLFVGSKLLVVSGTLENVYVISGLLIHNKIKDPHICQAFYKDEIYFDSKDEANNAYDVNNSMIIKKFIHIMKDTFNLKDIIITRPSPHLPSSNFSYFNKIRSTCFCQLFNIFNNIHINSCCF
ncbi:hypothetical protein HZS_2260, partial [Henneguya salminicola]